MNVRTVKTLRQGLSLRVLECSLLLIVAFMVIFFLIEPVQDAKKQNIVKMHQYLTYTGYLIQQSFVENAVKLHEEFVWEAEERADALQKMYKKRYAEEKKQLQKNTKKNAEYVKFVKQFIGVPSLVILEHLLENKAAEKEMMVKKAQAVRDAQLVADTKQRVVSLLAVAENLMEEQGPLFFVFNEKKQQIYTAQTDNGEFHAALAAALLDGKGIDAWRQGVLLMTQLDADALVGVFVPDALGAAQVRQYAQHIGVRIAVILFFVLLAVCCLQNYMRALAEKKVSAARTGKNARQNVRFAKNMHSNMHHSELTMPEGDCFTLPDEEESFDASRAEMWRVMSESLKSMPLLKSGGKTNSAELLAELPSIFVFEDALVKVWKNVRNSGHSVGILQINVDSMGLFNEEKGYAKGDELLFVIAYMLFSYVGKNGFFARYPGGEFAVILFESSKDVVQERAEALRKMLTEKLKKELPSAVKMTVSIGFSQMTADEENPYDAHKRAVCALEDAQKSGKNQVKEFNAKEHSFLLRWLK